VREIPDFPKEGILFYDITTVLHDPEGLRLSVEAMSDPWREAEFSHIACMESRGFIFGTPMALDLGKGMIPIRKPGKLPAAVHSASYGLEYGTDTLEIHEDAAGPGSKVLVVDDLLATGGTAQATVKLIESLGAEVVGVQFLIELTFLEGREKLAGVERIESVLKY